MNDVARAEYIVVTRVGNAIHGCVTNDLDAAREQLEAGRG